jgi:hypothetical protein
MQVDTGCFGRTPCCPMSPIVRRFLRLMVCAAFVCSLSVPAIAQSNSASPFGINLAQVNPSTTEQPFINIFKTALFPWDTGGGTYNPVQLDPDGYPTSMTPPGGGTPYAALSSLMLFGIPGTPASQPYQTGTYVLLYDGAGTVYLDFDAQQIWSTPGRIGYSTKNTFSGFALRITATDPNRTGNYIRNIRVVYAPTATSSVIDPNETAATAANAGDLTQAFNPMFIARISPFQTLRFMDWLNTNNSHEGASWSNRMLPSSLSYYNSGSVGVPVEVTVALANKTNADMWVNMPHQATDDYITQFATLVHQQLGSSQKVYVEYSNETWNFVFQQTLYMTQQGNALYGWSTTDYNTTRSYYGLRTVQMCSLWKTAWGADAGRVKCVMGGQAAGASASAMALQCSLYSGAPCTKGIDVLAIAPYFGYDVPNTYTLDQLFTEIMQGGAAPGGYPGGMIKMALDWTAQSMTVANSYGLLLLAYEGGQTLVNPNDSTLTTLYAAANRDPRMGAAYAAYLQGWKNAGGQLFNVFADIGSYSKWGFWGVLENVLATNSPKYDAIVNFISNNPCWWSGCGTTSGPSGPTSTADTTPPSVPAGLTATAASNTQVNLSWTASTDNVGVTGYKVFRNGVLVGTSPVTSYQDTTGLLGDTAYSYAVSAYDAAGNTSATSPSVSLMLIVGNGSGVSVTINSPSNGTAIKGNGSVNIAVSANTTSSLTITADSNALAHCPSATSCATTWQGKKISRGTHVIGGIAANKNGQASKSVTITSLK